MCLEMHVVLIHRNLLFEKPELPITGDGYFWMFRVEELCISNSYSGFGIFYGSSSR